MVLLFSSASVLRWNDVPSSLVSNFDIVICADCLFFDEFRSDLKECVKNVLAPGGLGIVTAPRRGETFGDFQILVQQDSELEIQKDSEDYSERISAVRDSVRNDGKFDANINYPKLLQFQKIISSKPPTNEQTQLTSNL